MRTLALFTREPVGRTMSGPGIRYYHFARELAGRFDTTLIARHEPGFEVEGVTLEAPPRSRLAERLAGFDTVIAQPLPFDVTKRLARASTRTIYDLYVPFVTENLGMLEVEQLNPAAELFARSVTLTHRLALASGSAFVCANERQRDFWLGMLAAAGRLELERYRDDGQLQDLIDVVPFGLPVEEPEAGEPVLRGVVPGIGADERILLWAGGIWNWFDPQTPIRAVAELGGRADEVKLVFLGLDHPEVPQMTAARRAVDLARELSLLDTRVFFRAGWVPYRERGRYLLEADLGVSAHFDTIETRYASRTRLLDYFWAGLPTITTEGDTIAELVAARGVGRVVRAGDVEGWARAIAELLDDEAERGRIRQNVEHVRAELRWPRVVEPLIRLAEGSTSSSHPGREPAWLGLEERWLRLRTSVALGGPGAATVRQLRKRVARAPRRR